MSNDEDIVSICLSDLPESCVIKRRTDKAILTQQIKLESPSNKEIKFIKEFVREYAENIASGITDVMEKLKLVQSQQSELELRMKKIEAFSETTAEELLRYYIEAIKSTEEDPDKVKMYFVQKLGRNSGLILLKKIYEVVLGRKDIEDSFKEKLKSIIKSVEES